MYVGRSPEKPPTENTLVVNGTHEILKDIRKVFENAVAVNPSRNEENDFGYDISIDWDWVKIFGLQFKSFDTKAPIRLNGRLTRTEYYKFNINKEQHEQLKYNFPHPRMAFYTLPVFPTRESLKPPLLEEKLLYYFFSDSGLEPVEFSRVFFVDVQDIPKGVTKISISTNSTSFESTVCYCKDRAHHKIDYKDVFSWNDIWEGLLICQMGAKFREDGAETGEIYDIAGLLDQPTEEKANDKIQDTVQIILGTDELPERASPWASDHE